MRFIKYISILILLATAIFLGCFYGGEYQIIEGKIFATYYHIKIKTNRKNNELQNKVNVVLDNVNRSMSVFEEASEINLINALPQGQKKQISADMSYLLTSAAKVYAMSDGAFDPTVAPLIEMWGFGVNHNRQAPQDKQIKQVLSFVGFDKIKLAGNELTKANGKTTLNLSAIAKGYAVDKVAELLDLEGYDDYVVEIGGEVKAKGNRDAQTLGWRVGIAAPTYDDDKNLLTVRLEDMALATSGDYRNYFIEDGEYFSHTISAQTGYPVKHKLAAVTVFDPSCMLADAYATAIMAQGEVKGFDFALKYKLPAVLLVRNKEQIAVLATPEAARLLGKNDE